MSDELLLHVDRCWHTCLYEYWHPISGDLLLHVHRHWHTSLYEYSHQTSGELLLHVQRHRYTCLSAHAYWAPLKVNMTLFITKIMVSGNITENDFAHEGNQLSLKGCTTVDWLGPLKYSTSQNSSRDLHSQFEFVVPSPWGFQHEADKKCTVW